MVLMIAVSGPVAPCEFLILELLTVHFTTHKTGTIQGAVE